MMNYLTEFPDFDYILPRIHGFEDSSWHNDGSPSLTPIGGDAEGWQIHCQHADKTKRAHPNCPAKFILHNGVSRESFEFNSLAEILMEYYRAVMESTERDRRARQDWFGELYRSIGLPWQSD
jgi:hypothetical protein